MSPPKCPSLARRANDRGLRSRRMMVAVNRRTDAEHLLERTDRQHRLRRSLARESAVLEAQHVVDVLVNDVRLVRYEQHGDPLPFVDLADEIVEPLLIL